MKISIIIPAYNTGAYLDRCLASVYHQKYQDWECIIINDGSTDNTQAIAEEWAKKDNRFRVFSQENKGVSSARNLGLDNAQGELITFVDSDDTIETAFLQDFIENIEGEDTIVLQDKNVINLDGEVISKRHQLIDAKYTLGKVRYDNEIFSPQVSNKLFYKSIIEKYNLRFDTDMVLGEDDKFFLEYLKYISYLKTLSVSHYNYIHRQGSAVYKDYDYQVHLQGLRIFNDLIDSDFTIDNHKNIDIKRRYSKHLYRVVEKIMQKPITIEEKIKIFKETSKEIRAEMFYSDKKKIEFLFWFYKLGLYNVFIRLWNKFNK